MKTLLTLLAVLIFSAASLSSACAQTKTIATSSTVNLGDVLTGTFAERTVTGKVVGVHDGDTCTVLDENKRQYKFRFNGIDAPELKMDFGQKSKQNLSDMIFGKTVTVKYSKKDKYGRFVGNVYLDGKDINLEQIKAGLAWHYKKYAGEQPEKERQQYADAETKAQGLKLGFWAIPNPTPPWDYRAGLKSNQAQEIADRKYLTGPRGGCYYVNSSGKKNYVDKKFCER